MKTYIKDTVGRTASPRSERLKRLGLSISSVVTTVALPGSVASPDWFVAETYTEEVDGSTVTKYRLKVNPKYEGLYTDGYLAGGGIGVEGVTPSVVALGDLTDVDLTTPPTDGQVLTWDDTAQKWVAGAGGGGGYLPLTGGTVTGNVNLVSGTSTSDPATLRFGDSTGTSLYARIGANTGGLLQLFAQGNIVLRPGGDISKGIVISTSDVTFNGTSLLGNSYTLPTATTSALGGIKAAIVDSGEASVTTTTYGHKYGLRVDAAGKGYIDIPSITAVSWGKTSSNTSTLTVGGTTKTVLLSGWAPDLSGYLPLTGGTMSGIIDMPAGTNNGYDSNYAFRFVDGNGNETARIRGASGTNSTTGAAQSWIGYNSISGHEFYVGGTRRFFLGGNTFRPGTDGTISLTSAGALSALGSGYDIGQSAYFVRAIYSKVIYLAPGIYVYYDTVNSCIRTNAAIVSDLDISSGGVLSS